MNKRTRKIINISFGIGLAVWFLTAIYLSIHSIINIFTNTNPYIANFLFAISFIWVVSIGLYNKYKRGIDFTGLKDDLTDLKVSVGNQDKTPKAKCKTCKQR